LIHLERNTFVKMLLKFAGSWQRHIFWWEKSSR